MWAPTKDDKIMMYVGIADYAEAGVSHARVNGVCGRWAFLTCSGRPAPGSPRPLSVSCGATVPVALKIVRPQKGRAEVVASINKNIILRCPWAGGASGGMGKVRFSDFWFRATDKTSHSDDGMWSGLSLLDTKYENFSWTKDYVLVHGGEYVVTLLKPPVKASFFLRGCNVCDCGPVAEESNEGA
jgi:hypothetical protein